MLELDSVSDILAQQPYVPVCLMTEIVCGTSYESSLDLFRRFRDNMMKDRGGRAGSLTVDFYYKAGRVVAPYVRAHPRVAGMLLKPYILLHRTFAFIQRRGLF